MNEVATQLPDIIILDGEEMNLYSNPLEEYWIKFKRRPAFIPSSVCRRGYVATWEIRDQQLFLNDVRGEYYKRSFLFGSQKVGCSLQLVFRSAKRSVKATWYTGKLRIPSGRMTHYGHGDYDSRFEREVILTVDRGDVIKTARLDQIRSLHTFS